MRRTTSGWCLALLVTGLLCALGAAAQAQFTPLVRSGTTGTKNATGTMSVAHVPTGIPAGNIGAGGVSDADFGALAGASALGGTLASQITDVNTAVTTLTAAATRLYLHNDASEVPTYETLSTIPGHVTEIVENVNVSSGSGPITIDKYLSDPGFPGTSKISAGVWRFHDFATVDSNTGVTQMRVKVYTRDLAGVETLRFTSDGPELVVGTTYYTWTYTQSNDIALTSTDRIVLEYQALTTSAGTRVVTHYYEGTARSSHIETAIPSPAAISGSANLVQATPNGATGVVQLRKVFVADLDGTTTARMFPITSAALANVTVCGSGSAWSLVPAAPTGWLYSAGPTGCQWVNALSGSTITFTNIPAATALSGQVPVANGGTGLSSYTTGALLYGASSSTTGQLTVGASNTVVTSNGTLWTAAALPTASSGTSTLASTFSLTTTDVYQNTGVSMTLPSAGTYLLAAQVKATLVSTTGAPYATCRLYNVTAGAVVPSSEFTVAFGTAINTYYVQNASSIRVHTVAAASTVRLECARRQATGWLEARIDQDADGSTGITYVKLAS